MTMLLRFDDTIDVDHPMYARYVTAEPGSPGPCPACDAAGVVESIERATHVQNQGCPACGYRWQYRFTAAGHILEVRELGRRRLDLLAPTPKDVKRVLDLRDGGPEVGADRTAGRSWWRRDTAGARGRLRG